MKTQQQPCCEIDASELVIDLEHGLIGRGGFASVYAAKWFSHDVAVKLVSLNDADVTKLKKEIGLLSFLNHPGIIRVFGITCIGEKVGIVMERASGSLNVPSPLTPTTLSHAKAITSTIAYLHAKGFIHRDLKPQNILMVNGQPKISDFETSKIISNTTTTTTMNPFTPKYAALEVFDHAAVQASDVYSLGVILYELLLNQIAFENSTQTTILFDKMKGIKLPFNQNAPKSLRKVITNCLKNDPEQRPLIQEIQKVLNDLEKKLGSDDENFPINQGNIHENVLLKQKFRPWSKIFVKMNKKILELLEDNQKQKEYINKMENCFTQMNEKMKDLNRIQKKLDRDNGKLEFQLQQLESEKEEEIQQLNKFITEQEQKLVELNNEKDGSLGRIDELQQEHCQYQVKDELFQSIFLNPNYGILPENFIRAVNDDEESFVHLSNSNLNAAQVAAISVCLGENQHLEFLDVSYSNINNTGAIALAESLKVNSKLKTLWLNNNPIGDQGIQYLAKVLEFNNSLDTLWLDQTNCTPIGVFALSQALKVNTKLEILRLDDNNIGDEGVAALCDGLRVNKNLRQLWLQNNNITSNGAMNLANALLENNSLYCIELGSIKIDDAGVDVLVQILSQKTGIKLELEQNNISSEKAKAIKNLFGWGIEI
ncbi:hypothetical protein P9112_006009 [Eukaryota sp. TZLM1-RC]